MYSEFPSHSAWKAPKITSHASVLYSAQGPPDPHLFNQSPSDPSGRPHAGGEAVRFKGKEDISKGVSATWGDIWE